MIPVSKRQTFKVRSTKQHKVPSTDRKSTRLNSSHSQISYAVFCLKKTNSSSFAQYTAASSYRRFHYLAAYFGSLRSTSSVFFHHPTSHVLHADVHDLHTLHLQLE